MQADAKKKEVVTYQFTQEVNACHWLTKRPKLLSEVLNRFFLSGLLYLYSSVG